MALTALRGGLAFLSRLPVGGDERAWEAFRQTPVAFPLVGYLLGALLLLPLLLPGPAPVVAFSFVVFVYVLTGITHLDGVGDLGDALAAHSDQTSKQEAMKDVAVGTGGMLTIGLVLLGVFSAAWVLADLARQAIVLVLVAEVTAKTAMALAICFGAAPFEGLSSAFTEQATPVAAIPVVMIASPVVLVTWPTVLPAVGGAVAGLGLAALVAWWATRAVGGVNGDVLGAINETARLATLLVGVMLWTQL